MKRTLKYFAVLSVIAAVFWGYVHREPALYRFSSFVGAKKKRFQDSEYAKSFRDAVDVAESHFRMRARIRWDLWCVAMSADVSPPKKKDGLIYFVVTATDRTDTRCIYVFSKDGELIEVAFQPLA